MTALTLIIFALQFSFPLRMKFYLQNSSQNYLLPEFPSKLFASKNFLKTCSPKFPHKKNVSPLLPPKDFVSQVFIQKNLLPNFPPKFAPKICFGKLLLRKTFALHTNSKKNFFIRIHSTLSISTQSTVFIKE